MSVSERKKNNAFFFFLILDHAHFIPSTELCIYKCTVIKVAMSGVKCMQGHI